MSSLGGQAFTVVFGRGLTRFAQFATFLILVRFLTPSEFGWYGIITSGIAMAALLGGLGLRQSMAYWIGQRRLTPGETLGTALTLWLPLAAVTCLASIVLFGHPDGANAWVVRATLSIAIASALALGLLQGVHLGRGQIQAFTVSENLPRLVLLVGVLALLVASQVTLENTLWVQAAGFALAVPIAFWWAARGSRPLRVRWREAPPMAAYGVIFAVNLFLLLLGARIAMFFIEQSFGSAEAGRFFAAIRVNEILLEVAAALGMVLFSHAARAENAGSSVLRNARISCWMFWLFAIGAGAIALLAPSLLGVIAGPDYASAAPALQILAIGLAPAAAAKVIYPTLAGSGHPRAGTVGIVVSLVVNLVLSALLVPAIGIAGGAVALVTGQFALYCAYATVCVLRFGVRPQDLLIPRRSDVRAILNACRSKFRRLFGR